MTPSNKIFFFALFISTVPTTALYCQKDGIQKSSKRTNKNNTLTRSSSIRQITKKLVSGHEATSIRSRSNSLGNQLERSKSFKEPRIETMLINNIPEEKRFSRLESYMKSQPDLLHAIIGQLPIGSEQLLIINKEGMNLLHIAAQHDQLIIAYALIKKGIDINSKTHAGKTALNIARENTNIADNNDAKAQHEQFIEFIELNNVPFTY